MISARADSSAIRNKKWEFTHVFGIGGSFVGGGCGRGWRASSCRQSACCSLDVDGPASLRMGRYEDLRYRVASTSPFFQMNVRVPGHHNHGVEKERVQTFGTT